MKMPVSKISDENIARKTDVDVKNKWRNEWLLKEDTLKRPYSVWCSKIDEPGMAYCCCCTKRINYGHNGRKSLDVHSCDPGHQKQLASYKHTSTLPCAEAVYSRPCKTDRVTDLKIRICAFIGEQTLPFSITEDLVDLIKECCKEPEALKMLHMSRMCATYTLTHGIAKHLKVELRNTLQTTSFSLNIDESTNNKNDKVTNILVRYVCPTTKCVKTQLLGSFVCKLATAENLFLMILEVLNGDDELNIPSIPIESLGTYSYNSKDS